MSLRGTLLVLVGLVAAAARPAPAQVLDRIVAVIGNRPILASELEEEFMTMQAQAQSQGRPFPTDSAERLDMRRQLLQQMVDLELLVQEAQRDTSIRVTDQEVQDAVERQVQDVRRGFSSESEFQRQLRFAQFGSVEEWRRHLADQQRRAILAQRLREARRQSGKLRPIPPTEAQMQEFWEANRGAAGNRPAVVSFRQIVVAPTPDSAGRAAALAKAESLLAVVRGGGGADFAAVAQAASDDSATAVNRGELGTFRRGMMVQPFERAAFRLRPGQISDVVETGFGFHIIQAERVGPAEMQARHILVRPEITPARLAAARRLADSIQAALAAGGSYDSLARRFADPEEQKLVESVPPTQLPPEYQTVLGADTTLGVKPTFVTQPGTARERYVVLEVLKRDAAGELQFEDVKDRIRSILGQQLAEQHLLGIIRRQTYVDIRF